MAEFSGYKAREMARFCGVSFRTLKRYFQEDLASKPSPTNLTSHLLRLRILRRLKDFPCSATSKCSNTLSPAKLW